MIERSSIFNPGGTFRNYVDYLEKVCYYMGHPATWYAPALVSIIKGLKLIGKAKCKFPNFLDSSILVRILNREAKQSEFAQLCYLAFLFALRIPSEALRAMRAYKGDQLNIFAPQAERALIGTRGSPWEES